MPGDPRKSFKKAKGIQKHYVKRGKSQTVSGCHQTRSERYSRAKFRNFKSTNHVVNTLEINKLCLSAFDDKRYMLKDGIQTLSYGHYSLRKASCPHSMGIPWTLPLVSMFVYISVYSIESESLHCSFEMDVISHRDLFAEYKKMCTSHPYVLSKQYK